MQGNLRWLSFSIFHDLSFEKVLSGHIHPLILFLEKEKSVESYFFIRYWEGGSHIRLRILCAEQFNSKVKKQIIEKTENYFLSIGIQHKKFKIVINEYSPEVDRYGGKKGMAISEEYFNNSSICVLRLINENNLNWDYELAITFAIQMHLIFMMEIFDTDEDRILFSNQVFTNWLSEAVRKNQSNECTQDEVDKLMGFFNESYKRQEKTIKKIIALIKKDKIENEALNKYRKSCKYFKKGICKLINRGELKYSFRNLNKNNITKEEQALIFLSDSYIHMNNNRLGIFLRDESFIAYVISKALIY